MPVPKSKEKQYGKIVGAMINKGYDPDEVADIVDRVLKVGKKKKRVKGQRGKKHE